MSSGWSWWVIGLIVFNLGVTFLLFLWAPRAKVPVLPDGTTGHVWAHGVLREGMHRLPGWWIVASFAMYFIAFGYLVLYPGFGNHEGALGWTSGRELAAATAANSAKLDPVLQRLAAMSVEAVAGDAQAQRLGARLFVDNCAACHGRDGLGNTRLGAPNLTDADWLYGGTGQDITTSIRGGRTGVMPPWSTLGEATVKSLAQYVLSLSGQPHDAAGAVSGEPTFKTNCVACHGPQGKGNPLLGAPNLTDDIWLYGGTLAAMETTIRDGRQGHMPAWSPRLSDDDIHVLAGYVYHLAHGADAAAR
ncbi:MAG: Cbb3-type cytochrome c oxidase subunit CcoP [Gammaproteobacteria bacterium]|nr:Cbb3-type cytochrome c oxidase subunit CcoP [Gammaproteobacteria bacterium]